MLDYAERALRLELVLCSKALREWHINMPCVWSEDMPKKCYSLPMLGRWK